MATTRHLWCRGSSGQQSCIWNYGDGDDDVDSDDDDGDGDDYLLRALKTRP